MRTDARNNIPMRAALAVAAVCLMGFQSALAQDQYRHRCLGEDECEIRIQIKDGERIVVVNGDTVETDEFARRGERLDDYNPPAFVWRGLPLELDDELRGFDGLHGLKDFTGRFEFEFDDGLRQMEKDARDLARRARRAEGGQREQLEAELNEMLAEIFEYKTKKQRESIADVADRLDSMRKRQQKREAARDEIIEQRKRQLLGEENYMEW